MCYLCCLNNNRCLYYLLAVRCIWVSGIKAALIGWNENMHAHGPAWQRVWVNCPAASEWEGFSTLDRGCLVLRKHCWGGRYCKSVDQDPSTPWGSPGPGVRTPAHPEVLQDQEWGPSTLCSSPGPGVRTQNTLQLSRTRNEDPSIPCGFPGPGVWTLTPRGSPGPGERTTGELTAEGLNLLLL